MYIPSPSPARAPHIHILSLSPSLPLSPHLSFSSSSLPLSQILVPVYFHSMWITFLLLWHNTMTNLQKERSICLKLLLFQGDKSRSPWRQGRVATGAGSWVLTYWTTSMKQRKLTGYGMRLSQWHTFSSKVTPPKPTEVTISTADHIFKHLSQ